MRLQKFPYEELFNSPELFGTYKGFAPTPDIGMGYGELEFNIEKDFINMTFANGFEVTTNKVNTSELKPGPFKCISTRRHFFKKIETIDPYYYDEYHCKYFFYPTEGKNAGLIIMNLTKSDSAYCFSPKQIKEGSYARCLKMILTDFGPNSYPTITNNGKIPR